MSQCAVTRVRRADSSCKNTLRRVLVGLTLAWLAMLGWGAAAAQEFSSAQMRGLDEQVQEIKSEVLEIAAELSLLEERLLYPSGTQVALFVALAEGQPFRLDAVQLRIGGALVAHHIYSAKELEALGKGGVQRIFTGNVPTGVHQLEVTVAGKSASGRDFSQSEAFSFSKGVDPKLVGITLGNPDGGAAIRVADW